MSQHTLPPPDFASSPSLPPHQRQRRTLSAGQQAESNEAYATAALRVLRPSYSHFLPPPPTADDE